MYCYSHNGSSDREPQPVNNLSVQLSVIGVGIDGLEDNWLCRFLLP